MSVNLREKYVMIMWISKVNLLEKYHTNPNYAHCLISLSFFSLVIKKDKILAKKWIERFDDLNISLNHVEAD